MRKNKFGLRSPMKSLLADFVRERRNCGYSYSTGLTLVRDLDRLLLNLGDGDALINREQYERYVSYRPGESPTTQAHRAGVWRQFAFFCRRQGIDAYVPERHELPIYHEDCHPFIYSRPQLAALFEAVEHLPNAHRCPHRIPYFRLLLRLLYGAGLRLGEALRLTIGDVDQTAQVLTIRQGKNKKDRLIPLSAGLAQRVAEHVSHLSGRPDIPLFRSPTLDKPISDTSIEEPFKHQLLKLAGLPPRAQNAGPRLHDLRHTFAVHRLENWFRAGEDVEAKLPYLSAYMGHGRLQDTYYYLRITATFFPEIARRLEARSSVVLPREGRP
jgi:integrase/recombinase XerD